ncbi:hypothetical protein RB597_005991 [Gaeumannomyces tritici]
MAENEIYQYSIISALMDGVGSSGLPISDLVAHGDHGLGTFRNMAGEMIVLDGRVFQMKSDGTVTAVDSKPGALDPADGLPVVAPFAMLTRFRPTASRAACRPRSKAELAALVSDLLPPGSRNLYAAFRLRGTMTSVTVRTADGQRFPGEPLRALGGRQVTHVFEREEGGTLFGFRSPAFSHGVSVAGDHMHFISADRRRGGHVLALDVGAEGAGVEVEVAPISRVHMELPVGDEQFDAAELALDSAGIKAVEGCLHHALIGCCPITFSPSNRGRRYHHHPVLCRDAQRLAVTAPYQKTVGMKIYRWIRR